MGKTDITDAAEWANKWLGVFDAVHNAKMEVMVTISFFAGDFDNTKTGNLTMGTGGAPGCIVWHILADDRFNGKVDILSPQLYQSDCNDPWPPDSAPDGAKTWKGMAESLTGPTVLGASDHLGDELQKAYKSQTKSGFNNVRIAPTTNMPQGAPAIVTGWESDDYVGIAPDGCFQYCNQTTAPFNVAALE